MYCVDKQFVPPALVTVWPSGMRYVYRKQSSSYDCIHLKADQRNFSKLEESEVTNIFSRMVFRVLADNWSALRIGWPDTVNSFQSEVLSELGGQTQLTLSSLCRTRNYLSYGPSRVPASLVVASVNTLRRCT